MVKRDEPKKKELAKHESHPEENEQEHWRQSIDNLPISSGKDRDIKQTVGRSREEGHEVSVVGKKLGMYAEKAG